MDNCQQACTELAIGIEMNATDADLRPSRARVRDAVNRVETAGNLAMLCVGREHQQVLTSGMTACAEETGHANHGRHTMGIVKARLAILEFARKETR